MDSDYNIVQVQPRVQRVRVTDGTKRRQSAQPRVTQGTTQRISTFTPLTIPDENAGAEAEEKNYQPQPIIL